MRLRFGVMPAPISAVRRTSVATWRPLERGQGERIILLGTLTDKPSIVLATVARYRRRNGVGRVRISRFLFTEFHIQCPASQDWVQAVALISPCISDRRFKRAR